MFCCFFSNLLLIALISLVKSHTVDVCYVVNGNDVTFYAGTYHSITEGGGQPTGGVIVGGIRYDFEGQIAVPTGTRPTGVVNAEQCSLCPSYTANGQQRYQFVTVSNLENGVYSVSTTTDTQIETPYCAFPDLTLAGIQSLSPTIQTSNPTNNPTFSPTIPPTEAPSISPTASPTGSPSASPTLTTLTPTESPTDAPTSYCFGRLDICNENCVLEEDLDNSSSSSKGSSNVRRLLRSSSSSEISLERCYERCVYNYERCVEGTGPWVDSESSSSDSSQSSSSD